MQYIATFYSHFGAIRFKKEAPGIKAPRLMPVPRSLSSSCGTCVQFDGPDDWGVPENTAEIEQIVKVIDGKYEPIYKVED
jgi:hypothetical protein